jgi:hypothetical protein
MENKRSYLSEACVSPKTASVGLPFPWIITTFLRELVKNTKWTHTYTKLGRARKHQPVLCHAVTELMNWWDWACTGEGDVTRREHRPGGAGEGYVRCLRSLAWVVVTGGGVRPRSQVATCIQFGWLLQSSKLCHPIKSSVWKLVLINISRLL